MLHQLAFAGTIPLGQFSDQASAQRAIKSARSRNRAAAWSYDLSKWYNYALSRAKTSAQIAVLDAEYERLRAQGPDFTGYHTGSEFREPPAHNITREDRIKILVQFDGIRAGLYKHCRSERGQAVSYNYRQVLGALLSFAVKRGRVFPSLDTIARMAMCSKVNGAQCNRMAGIIRLHRQAQAHRAHDGSARSEGAPDEQRLRVELPERSRRSRRQRLPLGPRSQQLGSIRFKQ